MKLSRVFSVLPQLCLALLFALGALGGRAQPAPAPAPGAERTAWFTETRYGLFIHWGLSSVLGGSYHGRPIDRDPAAGSNGLGEWIMFNAKIPVAEYAGYAKDFNPVKFDAEAWVTLAQEAGMKYIVITTKHHEGFAMFKSAASRFNVVDATPFGRDPLKELAEACARHGMKLGFYYSQAQDWHHAGGSAKSGPGYNPGGDPNAGHWDRAQDGSFDDYLTNIAIPQVKELLTNYGPVATFWWDSPHGMTPARAARLAEVLKLQPHLITNNRLLNPRERNAYSGDTETPEQFIPATGFKDRLFEVCMTMNESWGYKAHDRNWKPATDITRKLIDIASKGGNFLLNVGPDAQGEIPAPSVERLKESGRWVRANGESIYGTHASLFRQLTWGRSTTKGNVIYLHVFDWPADGRLAVPGLQTPVVRASLLASREPLATETKDGSFVVKVPATAPDAVATVIKLEFDRAPVVDQPLPAPDAKGVVDLPATLAAVVNAYGANARLLGAGADAHIGEWDRANTVLSWEFSAPHPATFTVEAEVAGAAPVTMGVTLGKVSETAKVAATGGINDFQRRSLGRLVVTEAGDQHLELKSLGEDWQEVCLRGIRLVPLSPVAATAEPVPEPTRIIAYKKVGDVELTLHIFEPTGHQAGDRAPAIVLFFGGAWRNGTPAQFYPQCAYFAARGIWAAAADYRVKNRHNTTPVECVEDGKSALRYVRSHAAELGIDPDRLAAGGGSAGGHVAAAAATTTAFDEATDDLKVSPVPNALVLFNPVYDNGPGGWGHDQVAAYWEKISPRHNIRTGMPPAIVFLGREDKLIPVVTAEKFQAAMHAVGSRSELRLYDGAGHGFFNPANHDGKYFWETMREACEFLVSLGYKAEEPAKGRLRDGF